MPSNYKTYILLNHDLLYFYQIFTPLGFMKPFMIKTCVQNNRESILSFRYKLFSGRTNCIELLTNKIWWISLCLSVLFRLLSVSCVTDDVTRRCVCAARHKLISKINILFYNDGWCILISNISYIDTKMHLTN